MTSANHPTRPASPRVAVTGIARRFGERWALQDCTFERSAPGIAALLGANGSGKTTLLRMLAQLLEPSSGSAEICGIDVAGDDCARARELVGYAPHRPLAYDELGVHANLVFAARLAGNNRSDAKALADRAIDNFALGSWGNDPVRALSRGWQQRYSLARADLLEPPILLLDEPTTGLDTAGRRAVEHHLDAWRRDRIVLVATHEREWIAERTDQSIDLEAQPR